MLKRKDTKMLTPTITITAAANEPSQQKRLPKKRSLKRQKATGEKKTNDPIKLSDIKNTINNINNNQSPAQQQGQSEQSAAISSFFHKK